MESVYNSTTVRRETVTKRAVFFASSFWEYGFPLIVGALTTLDFCCTMIIGGEIRASLVGAPFPELSMAITAFITIGILTTCALVYNRMDSIIKPSTIFGCLILAYITLFADLLYFFAAVVQEFTHIVPNGVQATQVNIGICALRCLLISRVYNYVYNVEGTKHPITLTAGGAFAGVALSGLSLLATSFSSTLMYVNGATALFRISCIVCLSLRYIQLKDAHSDPTALRVLQVESCTEYIDPFDLYGSLENTDMARQHVEGKKFNYKDPSPSFKTVLPLTVAVALLALVTYCMYPQVIYDVYPMQLTRSQFAAISCFIASNAGHLTGSILSQFIPAHAARSILFPLAAFIRGAVFILLVLMSNYLPGAARHWIPQLIFNDWAFIGGIYLIFVASGCMLMMAFKSLNDAPQRFTVYVVSVINVGTVLGIVASTGFQYVL